MEEKTAQKAGTASVRNFPSTNAETYKRAKSVKSEHPIEFRKDKKKFCFPVYQDKLLGFQEFKEEVISMVVD